MLKPKGFVLHLLKEGLLDDEIAGSAEENAHAENKPLTAYLLEKNLISSELLAENLSIYFDLPKAELDNFDLGTIPQKVLRPILNKFQNIIPLYIKDDTLFIGALDPSTVDTQSLSVLVNLNISILVCDDKQLKKALKSLRHENNIVAQQSLDEVIFDGSEVIDKQIEPLETVEDDSPVIEFIDKVLTKAIEVNASDIHFEMYDGEYRIRYRIDGILREEFKPPFKLAQRHIARLKVISRLNISERRVPQDGRFKLKISDSKDIDFRINTCPVQNGEKVVVRVLDSDNSSLGFEKLGFDKVQQKHVLDSISRPQGMILVTGATGSGKTVTLYTAINHLNSPERNICTAEDPVEINMHGINQVNINPAVDLDFGSVLRAFLRQDPDIIMVGEMRDFETADIAIKAAQTGHLVFATLHTNSAIETINRLKDIGIASFNLGASISLIVSQKLLRRLCDKCKKTVKLPVETLLNEGFTESDIPKLKLYEPVGCSQCINGYKGRMGIFEVMPISKKLSQLIMKDATSHELAEQAIKEGFHDLRSSALQKVKTGETSMQEANRATRE